MNEERLKAARRIAELERALREALRFVPGGDLHGCEPGVRLAEWRRVAGVKEVE
jgi:hypothetical protein